MNRKQDGCAYPDDYKSKYEETQDKRQWKTTVVPIHTMRAYGETKV
jgi:hypothetical protein